MRKLILLLGTAAGALAGWYLHTDLGFGLEQASVIQPPGAWELEDGSFAPREDYLSHFMDQFSLHYFGHESRFPALYWDEGESKRTYEMKAVLRNLSHGKGQTLSTIEAVVTATEKATFPWYLLDVTAEVEVHGDGRWALTSTGVGPALDLKWQTTSGDLVLTGGGRELLHHDTVDPLDGPRYRSWGTDRRFLDESYEEETVRAYTQGDSLDPLFLRVAGPGPGVIQSPGDYLEACHTENPPPPSARGWFKTLTSVQELREVTSVVHGKDMITIATAWESLRGERSGREDVFEVPENTAFWQSHPDLYESDPRCAGTLEGPDVDRDGIMDSGNVGIAALTFLAGDRVTPDPGGVDFYVTHLAVDLQGLGLGRIAAIDTPDVILNPRGLLFIYLKIHQPGSFHYTVSLGVAGVEVSELEITPLVPEHLTFEDEGRGAAVKRLRELFQEDVDEDSL